MNMQEIIEKINNKQATRKEIATELDMSETTLSRRIKEAGYKYDNRTKQFELIGDVPNKESFQQVTKAEKKEINYTESKQSEKPERRQTIKQTEPETKPTNMPTNAPTKKVTYEIEEWLHDELKIKAIRDKRTVSDIVNEFIKKGMSE